MNRQISVETISVHLDGPDKSTGAIIPPIYLSTTFLQKEPGVSIAGYEYSRTDNPTRCVLEKAIARLENSSEQFGVAFSSGSAVLSSIVLGLCNSRSNNRILAGTDLYGGTHRFLSRIALEQMDIKIKYIDVEQENILELIGNFLPTIIWIESPSNPNLQVADITHLAEIAHSMNSILVVDNSFMTPYLQNPLKLGADIVIHSATKAINGHCDAMLGVAVTNDAYLYKRLKFMQNALGAVPSPFDCYLVLRGIKTLCIRMKKQSETAKFIVDQLRNRNLKCIDEILYPDGIKKNTSDRVKKQHHLNMHGSMFSIVFNFLDSESMNRFLAQLHIFTLAESLGGVESLIQVPLFMTHSQLTKEQRERTKIPPFLIRFSIGLEDATDLLEDILIALNCH